MKSIRTALIALCFLALNFSLKAQNAIENPCKQEEKMQEAFEKYPGMKNEFEIFNEQTQNTPRILSDCESYVLPVVFHVFHNGGSSSVTPGQLQSALDKANEDFKGLNYDFNTIDPEFDPIKGTLNLTLALATIDPWGEATTGINYYSEYWGFGNTNMDATIASYAWDNYKYLNIYVMIDLYGDGGTNNSGVAWLPNSWMSDNGLARIVYNPYYLGNQGLSWADDEFQSTFTHEVGHYLNLDHTFYLGCSDDGDYVADTPTTEGMAGCGPGAYSCGHTTNGENYMDYNSSCYKMFTQGQIDRMRQALENHPARNTLWQYSNLVATGTEQYFGGGTSEPVAGISASTYTTFVGEQVAFTDASCGEPTSWSWTFQNGNPSTSTIQNPSASFTSPGVKAVTLTTSNSLGSDEETIYVEVLAESACITDHTFESTSVGYLPTGWTQSVSGSASFSVEQDVYMGFAETVPFTSTAAFGDNAIYCSENWDGSGPAVVSVTTPYIDLDGVVSPSLSYYDQRGWDNVWPEYKPEHDVRVQVSTNGTTFNTIYTDVAHESEFHDWREIDGIDLSAYEGQSVKIRFETDEQFYYWRLDNLCIESPVSVVAAEADDMKILLDGSTLFVKADEFEMYTLTGKKVASSALGKSVSMNDLARGSYIVKMKKGEAVKSVKVVW